MLIAIKDAAVECRDAIVEQSNQKIDYRKFYIPHSLLNNRSSSRDLQYVIQQISTISSAEALSLAEEVDDVIEEINKQVNSEIWQQSDISTRTSYYLGKIAGRIEESIDGENGRLLDHAINAIPENIEVRGRSLPIRTIANVIVAGLRLVPNGALKLTEITYDNIDSLACVEGNLQEIERFVAKIEEIIKEKQDLSDRLAATNDKIKNQVIERMNDGKFTDKKFVEDVYKAFLYNYLDYARTNPNNLLYHDIEKENFNTKKVAEKIITLLKEVEYEKFGDFLINAIKKQEPDFDIIKVLIVNSAPLFSCSITDEKANRNLRKLMQKSFHNIMIDVHNLLFNFNKHFGDIDVDVSLLSCFPNRDGSYTESCKNNIMLKGNRKQQALLKEIRKFINEIEELKSKGGLNRVRGWGYFGLHFLLYKCYDSIRFLFNKYEASSEEECSVIDEKIKEFLCKAQHSIAIGSEGMIKEYIEEIKERMKIEENSDVRELYKIVSCDRWRDVRRQDRDNGWRSTPDNETLEKFIYNTSKRISELDKIQAQGERAIADQRTERAEEGKRASDQRAEKESKGRQEAEQRAEQNAQRAEKLAEALRQAGIVRILFYKVST
ncbi:cell envelope integrity protein TolA [Wolbachia endosymbiont of Ctenocephalides felis wCfeT]|uniref:cell envelope integrity protein TolA n=1 Tax=Wolbachia endosymbiont of Ctenocephalides felis wCfeT TaxID=2732593 RepID=UPI00144846A2|nr:cell envelope integrity protein TolA [Wolbachia endosymbiont of Ctenocephalides felis wCfeT]